MDTVYAREYEKFELSHWWFVSRRKLITELIDQYVPVHADTTWLDVGCGTGVLLQSYQRIATKIGLELNAESVLRSREKGLDVRSAELDRALSSYGQFDLITMCDVIEHLEDDVAAVAGAAAALKPGGVLLITVPALQTLWSDHDVVNHHYRRYSMRSLVALFSSDERWEVLRRTYFSSFLLPLIWTARKLKNLKQRFRPQPAAHDLAFGPRWLDGSLLAVFRTEVQVLRFARMPIGSSLVLVARRRAVKNVIPAP